MRYRTPMTETRAPRHRIRGHMHRRQRLMSDVDAREFLKLQKVAHRFFDHFLAKYGQPDWTFSPGYPLLDRIILYEQQIELVTGKRSDGLYH
jgi:hypothetical protein